MLLETEHQQKVARGAPGLPACWTTGAKSGIGKAVKATSDISFTIGQGILNEIYYPWEDEACVRDIGFMVADGKSFFSEEKKDTVQTIKMVSPGVPAYLLSNTCKEKRYRIDKEIISDPIRNTVLQQVRFRALRGSLSDYGLYVLLAPHLGNQGGENTAWIGDYKGVPMLFAQRDHRTLALACSTPWIKRSAGFVGFSDGWRDILQHKKMEWEYDVAENGNIALTAQIDLEKTKGLFTVALGFGHNADEAGYAARGSLLAVYKDVRKRFVDEWRNWQKRLSYAKSPAGDIGKLFRISASVLHIHEANRIPGAIIASMSIPWGEIKGDNDTGGYHVVWPRDLVESSGGLLALHAKEDTLRILTYLMTTQEADGHWVQNMWIHGKPHWRGIQMDQTALPVLLIDLVRQHRTLKPDQIYRYWITVKKALGYIVRNGPYTEQDRWERDGGLSIFTVATEIAALLAGADFAEKNNEPEIAAYCREIADCWNDHIEKWFYVTGTPLAKKTGVEGYYIRLNPFNAFAEEIRDNLIKIKNHPEENAYMPLYEMVSPDALALVRFGLRAADDQRILNTIRVIDAELKVDTPYGPCWHRYAKDGYGEHEDGSPYDGTGIGRVWPLLTGERAHYEIAAGNLKNAKELTESMESFAHNGLLPEQIWDTTDIPEKDLFFGKPTGGAMPLVWAHAEYIKLCASLKDKKVFDMPAHTQERYIHKITPSNMAIWRINNPVNKISADQNLRIETSEPAIIYWSEDGKENRKEIPACNSGLGVWFADIPAGQRKDHSFVFTLFWKEKQNWEGKDFEINIYS